ncbi:MAG: SIMPL domain-containing protein [Myxococcales bacterium]|nr:SIMPL domain-containing protein [Myxococcales bacterium]MCB9706070.1 SIMPL domain-containing protein [Myxococcales bacterium]
MYTSQSIQRPVGINVFGSCLLATEPDYASIRCSVAGVAATPAPAFEGARARLQAVRDALRDGGVASRDVQVSRLNLEIAYEGPYNEREMVGYRGQADLIALARDLDALEGLLQRIVEAGALISDVSYKTSELVALRRRARDGAVAAARRKAEAYAAAAGAQLGGILHLEDLNPEELSRRSHAPDIDLAAEGDEASAAAAGSIRVAGAVMACYAILRGP